MKAQRRLLAAAARTKRFFRRAGAGICEVIGNAHPMVVANAPHENCCPAAIALLNWTDSPCVNVFYPRFFIRSFFSLILHAYIILSWFPLQGFPQLQHYSGDNAVPLSVCENAKPLKLTDRQVNYVAVYTFSSSGSLLHTERCIKQKGFCWCLNMII